VRRLYSTYFGFGREGQTMTIDPHFIVSPKGKEYVVYAGALDAATKAGLRSLRTTLIQAPSKDNAQTAIVKAVAIFEDGREFEDVGDAGPATCSAQIAAACIRMASTRAKGRVLRDALNVGQALLEEMPDEPEHAPGNTRPQNVKHAPLCAIDGCGQFLTANEINTSRKYHEELNNRLLCEEHLKQAAAEHKAAKSGA